MKISLIAAMASNRAIGLNKQMPWHLSVDLKKFKQITMGFPVLMGRKTFESIGKPLPGRTNIIITRNPDYKQQHCMVFNNVEKAIAACQQYDEMFVIGGAALYELMLPVASTLYLTQINKRFEGDTFFPEINAIEWREVAREEFNSTETIDFSYSFIQLERITQ